VVLEKNGEDILDRLCERCDVLHRVKEERNVLHTAKRRKADWIGHTLRRNCLLKHVPEGKLDGRIETTGRGGRRRKQLLMTLRKIEDTEN
jgi:hypothetical protein